MIRRIEVGPDDAGRRLDQFLAAAMPELSRSLVQRLISEGLVDIVRVSGPVSGGAGLKHPKRTAVPHVRPSEAVKPGDAVEVEVRLPPSLTAEPEPIELRVIYEDEAIAVLDKPAGLVVHPAPGHAGGTLVNALVHRYPQLMAGENLRPGLVHRLDKDTSGLMVVALTAEAQAHLTGQLRVRRIRREYLALVSGHPEPKPHVVDAPVGRDPKTRLKMAVGVNTIRSRSARTRFEVEEYVGEFALLRARLETGRTHQIRVHLAFAGFPVCGDPTYGGLRVQGLDRQFLHAALLELTHPRTEQTLRFESPLPDDLEATLNGLRLGSGSLLLS